ncbi:AsnC family transcriptional regulator [Murinocardiopsis flavida]|uniref:AsnC family transcriptional regulator n=1 Tax=Murinocardiopsis flavida TaxID=645275 RepID=A0A2P8DP78_9ACTN|nr:Lrp/AsnC family transcriptional regulator [Murinocardiopsis flavida]PSK99009.1 AsnC family transcriptional regulator [Murinocardiopsis flavida]
MLDDLDLDLIAALQVAPRAPANVVADVLGASASTVGRRIQRLHAESLLRVIGQVDWRLFSDARPRHVWISTVPGRAQEVAHRLAERGDTQFVAMTSGDADVYGVLHPRGRAAVRDLLTLDVPSIPGIVATRSDLVLRPVSRADSWRLRRLTPDRVAALEPHAVPAAGAHGDTDPLSPQELAVARLLHRNGRTASGEVARELGVSQSTAYRVVQSLLGRGVVRPRVEVEPALLGMGLEAVLALTVQPGAITAVADALADDPHARYVTIVAGAEALILHGVFPDEERLADFLSVDLARLPGVGGIRVSVVLDVLCRYWIRRDGVRLGAADLPLSEPHPAD